VNFGEWGLNFIWVVLRNYKRKLGGKGSFKVKGGGGRKRRNANKGNTECLKGGGGERKGIGYQRILDK